MSDYRQQQENIEVYERIAEALAKAQHEPINKEDLSLLQWATGVKQKESE